MDEVKKATDGRMTQVEFSKVLAWLKTMRDRFEKDQTSYEAAAAMAAESLGFSVTKDALKGVVKRWDDESGEEQKLQWFKEAKCRGNQPVKALNERVGAMEGHVESLSSQGRQVMKSVGECEDFILKQGMLIDQLQAKTRTLQADVDTFRGLIVKLLKKAGEPIPSTFYANVTPTAVSGNHR